MTRALAAFGTASLCLFIIVTVLTWPIVPVMIALALGFR